MRWPRFHGCCLIALIALTGVMSTAAQPAPPAPPTTAPAGGALPHITVDRANQLVRVECEALDVDAPLEFFCVVSGTNEHESVLRTPARPSHLHLALIMLGLTPGEPIHFVDESRTWIPPHGPPLTITMEYQKDGQTIREPAHLWMRNVETGEPMPPLTWVFTGSRIMDDGNYAADITGYVVSVVNFDLTLIDVPQLASNANETLEWERNPEKVPPKGTKVTMIISPAPHTESPTTRPIEAGAAAPLDMPLVVVDAGGHLTVNDKPVTPDELTRWLLEMSQTQPVRVRLSAAPEAPQDLRNAAIAAVQAADVPLTIVDPSTLSFNPATTQSSAPQAADMEPAAQLAGDRQPGMTHDQIVAELRRVQDRLMYQSDQIGRLIDQLETDRAAEPAP